MADTGRSSGSAPNGSDTVHRQELRQSTQSFSEGSTASREDGEIDTVPRPRSLGRGSVNNQAWNFSGSTPSESDSVRHDREPPSAPSESSVEQTPQTRLPVSRPVAVFLERTLRHTLTRWERAELVKKFPRPDTPAASTPALDRAIAEFLNTKKLADEQWFSLQNYLLDAIGPLGAVLDAMETDPTRMSPVQVAQHLRAALTHPGFRQQPADDKAACGPLGTAGQRPRLNG